MQEKEWIYYSTLVPGYVQKYGISGMRERNKKYIKELQSKDITPQKQKEIRCILIENNRPLAMYVSHMWSKNEISLYKDKQDLYQECCLAMTKHIQKLDFNGLNPTVFQVSLYYIMSNQLKNEQAKLFSHEQIKYVRFEEDEHPIEEEKSYGINPSLIRKLLPLQESEILFMYYGIGYKQMSFEEIGELFNLTGPSIRIRLYKAIKHLKKRIRNLINTTNISRDDFLKECWEYNKYERLPKLNMKPKETKQSFHSIFYGTNNSALKK